MLPSLFLLLLLQNKANKFEIRSKNKESEKGAMKWREKERDGKKHIVIKYKSDLLMNLLICANKIL